MNTNNASSTQSPATEIQIDNQRLYFITAGYYVGETWFFGEKIEKTYHFLCVNKKELREVSEEKLVFGILNKIVEPSEKLTDTTVLQLLSRQYQYNVDAKRVEILKQKINQPETEEKFPTDYNDEEDDN